MLWMDLNRELQPIVMVQLTENSLDQLLAAENFICHN